MKSKKIILYVVLVISFSALAFWYFRKDSTQGIVSYQTAEVKIASVRNTVTATGTIEPLKQVQVGTQVSGVIKKIYVDFNSVVKSGQLLAEIDKTPLLAQLASIEADLLSAQSQLTYQEANYNRIKQLLDKKAVSETDYETALYQYNNAKANLAKMKSEVDRAKTNLGYAVIYSPIDGVVLNRAVDEGQTVAASFNTPTLFTIAQDLTKMQVVANVDEADIGQVKEGQKVTFTVDAYPEETFNGTVKQVRLLATTNSNVVTYSVVIDAPNPALKLKPGLTASITVCTQEASDVLTIPSKALRFKPDTIMVAATAGPGSTSMGEKPVENSKTVWVKQSNKIYPAVIVTGLDDETNVEVKSGLKEGEKIIITAEQGIAVSTDKSNSASQSPFMPKRPGSK
jgi:HlyD family secretion protein